ncbi:MAG TPA: NTP transferase domain-containing protein [Planctomycetes bacterium]|nr:NTP transferase domain-containing protein [Planctomycetota bacterium]HIJ72166.1 NTP transferase domain-containing protein [Planctomycetota bacterium]
MIELAGILMVGSLERGLGKTRFACSLIRKFSHKCDIIGIKVTTIKEPKGGCPHEAGCGVCSSLNGHYDITEETESKSDKDTCRMLAAGAARVFWLRVLKTHLEEGILALLDIIGDDAICVCESNSLRRVAEPGLFVMVKGGDDRELKPSGVEVARLADLSVCFHRAGFDFDLDDIGLADGMWSYRAKATAIIMAGGDSRRLGRDKCMLEVAGQPMIKHIYDQLGPNFSEILISSNDKLKYDFTGARVVPDRVAGQGPLMGIASAIEVSANDINFVMACDIPRVDTFLMRRMLRECRDFDGAVPRLGGFRYEPLFAVYRKNMLKTINKLLAAGVRKIDEVYNHCRISYTDISDSRLRNINTIKDYREFVDQYNDNI